MIGPGTVIADRYRVTRLIGEGGMGAVYEAEHVAVGRRVAVKVLHANFARKEGVVERFEREARAAGAIGHENIIDIIDFGVQDGEPYMVMEYLRGEGLGARIEREGKLSIDSACLIMGQVLSALHAAHSVGIVHRDLKPDNVFLLQRGGVREFVKLLDFGISKVNEAGAKSLTKTGTLMGTPYYMSPEQATAKADVDSRADVYSAGVMLYELLTGCVPFDAESEAEILIRICTRGEEPRVPHEIDPTIPLEMDAIIRRAMSYDRENRYQTAQEMLDALRPFGATGVSLPELATGSFRALTPNPGQTPTHVGTPTAWMTPTVSPTDEKRPAKRSSAVPTWAVLASALAIAGAGAFAYVRSRSTASPAVPAATVHASDSIQIELRGVPGDARIWLDGRAVADRSFQLARGSQHQLRVEAPGRVPYESSFSADRNELMSLSLAPLPAVIPATSPAPVAPAPVVANAAVVPSTTPAAPPPARPIGTHATSTAPHPAIDHSATHVSGHSRPAGSLLPATEEY